MNERLVEDWLTKASERSYQTSFAQSLLAEGKQVLRIGHSPHEHGKDIIAIDEKARVHVYQLKDGDLDLRNFEKEFGQITALVMAQVEHPAISGKPRHQPWLVVSGQLSIPVEDRIRVLNLTWRKQGLAALKTLTKGQLLRRFTAMAADFWPQTPEDSRNLLSLYLANGKGSLDLDAFAKLIGGVIVQPSGVSKAEVSRRLAAANLFASYALASFTGSANHWEVVQGWTITAAHIAWAADNAGLARCDWHQTFRLAVNAAMSSLDALAEESLKEKALGPGGFGELDELTRARCTICAGAVAVKILNDRKKSQSWDNLGTAKETIERLFRDGRFLLWGESAVPFFLATMWAIETVRGDQLADGVLLSVLSALARLNSRGGPKLPPPYDSADEANSKVLRRLFENEKAMELQAAASYTLEPLVVIAARRLWRNALAAIWSPITKVDLVQLVPDTPRDLLLWRWGHERGTNQSRLFEPRQSWRDLLAQSRTSEDDALPSVIKEESDFALLFLLCYPHRLTRAFVKHLEKVTSDF